MKKFEYKLLDVPTKGWWGGKIDFDTLTQKLNELGSLGWEVANTTAVNMYQGTSRGLVIILKREK